MGRTGEFRCGLLEAGREQLEASTAAIPRKRAHPTPASTRSKVPQVVIKIRGGHLIVELPAVLAHLQQELLVVFPVRPIVMYQGPQSTGQPTGCCAGIGVGRRAEAGNLPRGFVQRPAERAGKQRVCDD